MVRTIYQKQHTRNMVRKIHQENEKNKNNYNNHSHHHGSKTSFSKSECYSATLRLLHAYCFGWHWLSWSLTLPDRADPASALEVGLGSGPGAREDVSALSKFVFSSPFGGMFDVQLGSLSVPFAEVKTTMLRFFF